MANIYGHRWTSSFGESDVNGVWLAGLKGLTNDLIRDGLNSLVISFKTWPPSLPEFKSICLGLDDRRNEVSNAIHGEIKTPLGKIIYNLVGHWDMTTQRSSYLEKRCNEVYDAAVSKLVISKFAGIYKLITNGDNNA